MAEGKCVVIGLQTTGQAADDAVQEGRGSERGGERGGGGGERGLRKELAELRQSWGSAWNDRNGE